MPSHTLFHMLAIFKLLKYPADHPPNLNSKNRNQLQVKSSNTNHLKYLENVFASKLICGNKAKDSNNYVAYTPNPLFV